MSKFEIWHPGHEHALVRYRYEELSFVFQTCHGRRHELPRTDANFIWEEMECESYLDVECARLKDEDVTIHHPLHPQHLLILNFNDERNQFVCNFYGETKESSFFYDCGHDQCDFYLDVYCSICLASNKDLHEKYEIQHFLHDQNHRLSPFIQPRDTTTNEPYGGCGRNTSERLIFHCNSCSFYLHVPCSQIPEEDICLDDVSCHVYNAIFYCFKDKRMLRCVVRDFNIHLECWSLLDTIIYDDHVHPFTLTRSFREDNSGVYYCDVCEERRYPDHGVYVCEECSAFVAHFKCVLPMWEVPSTLRVQDKNFITEVKWERDN
nr:uncharacterized protein LOC125418639 [Ziziphus jujuba var. spinosa]